MARGTHWWNEPPWWAWTLMVVGAVVLIVELPFAIDRGRLSADEVEAMRDRVEAARSSPSPTAATTAPSTSTAAPSSSVASPRSLEELRENGLSVYVIGDSLTEGYNASTQTLGFRTVLVQELQDGGEVNPSTDYRAGATLEEVADAANPPPAMDVAVVALGTADVDRGTPPEAFRTRYGELLVDLDERSARLVCLGVYRSGDLADALDDAIRETCADSEGTFVPIDDLFDDEAYLAAPGSPGYPDAADGDHPNDAGHAEIAQRIVAVLAEE